jgi:predicted TIM-barrel fold metal-dependent hydrolase
MSNKSDAAAIHSRLKHPVIDSDGHWIEFEPAALDYVKKVGGESLVARFTTRTSHFGNRGWSKLTPEERSDRRMLQPPWWALPTKNTRDRATAMLPRLLYERMDEIGLDFAVLYPTNIALFAPFQRDDEVRRATCRACNMFIADLFGEFKDRIAPAGVIPMHTPEEAIEELEFAVKTLGLKAVMLGSLVRRPVKAAQKEGSFNRYAVWTDTLGIDSPCDYDAVWAKCVELKINPTFHSASSGLGFRTSPRISSTTISAISARRARLYANRCSWPA